MIYVDTNAMVAYINPKDSLHSTAKEYLAMFAGKKLVTSMLSVVELYSVFSRIMKLDDAELEALVEFTLRKCGVSV